MSKAIDNTYNKYRLTIEDLLVGTGVEFNGENPWDIQVYNADLYERIMTQGTIGFGEAYMDGSWECQQLDELFNRLCSAQIQRKVKLDPQSIKNGLWSYFINRQRKNIVSKVIRHHYDIGNDLYKLMLDKRLTYSCAYWKNAKNLDEAQEHKFDLICRKLNLQVGQKVLDIGCGWGSFMKFAVENYRVTCVGVTLSNEQHALATELCQGFPIDVRLADYRDLYETFDHIVSIGMFEHVGHKNYRRYMEQARRCLKDDGLFLLHTIGGNRSVMGVDPWIEKYIFPAGMLPSVKQIATAIEGLFIMEDWHNFGTDYDKTLMAWHDNFTKHWVHIANHYDERFYRMWTYYLLSCAGAFRARANQLWQIVLSKHGVAGGYVPVR